MKLGNLLLLIGIVCLLFTAPVLLAQQPADEGGAATETSSAPVLGPGLKVGVVDIDSVRDGWSVVQELHKQEAYVNEVVPTMIQAEWNYRQTLLCFTEDEMEEAVGLWRKRHQRAATDAELARLDDLDKDARERAQRFQDLAQKQDALTEEEKREYGFLKEIRNARIQQLGQVEKAYGEELASLKKDMQEADQRALEHLRAATQRVGEALELDYVFTKEALLFGGTDISQQVIDDLQANVPTLAEAAGDEEGAAGP